MNYDIHVGAIAGLSGRVAMFFAALVVACLPVTGCIIWWGKRKKKQCKPSKKPENTELLNNHLQEKRTLKQVPSILQ